ncbi:MAG: transcriptional regulator [Microthrixaceae bacterium]
MADDALLVLHALRLRSLATPDVVAARFDVPPARVTEVLEEARTAGWVTHREGRLSGWSLTAEGRAHAAGLLAEELAATGTTAGVTAAYGRFLVLNPELLAICTDWQVVDRDGEQVVNDHSDAGHDEKVLARLDDLHAAALPVTGELAGLLERLGGYGARLSEAHRRVRAGETDWLTRPVIDSYHTVWFELHEDLLATLGRERSQERQ